MGDVAGDGVFRRFNLDARRLILPSVAWFCISNHQSRIVTSAVIESELYAELRMRQNINKTVPMGCDVLAH